MTAVLWRLLLASLSLSACGHRFACASLSLSACGRRLAVASLSLSACGHRFAVAPISHPVEVRAAGNPGADVDAEAELGRAVRRALGGRLSAGDEPAWRLELTLERAAERSRGPADPARRAIDYVAELEVEARAFDERGRPLGRRRFRAEAPFLAVPGPIEALDGRRRWALGIAAERAAGAIAEWLAELSSARGRAS